MRGHSIFLSLPQRPMTSDFEGFSMPDFIHYIYFPILNPFLLNVYKFWQHKFRNFCNVSVKTSMAVHITVCRRLLV